MGTLRVAMIVQYAAGGAFLPFVTLFFRDRGLDYDHLSWAHLTAAGVSSTAPFFWGWVADRWLAAEKLLALLHLGGAAALLVLSRQTSFAGLLAAYAVLFALYPPTGSIIFALAYHNLPSPETQFGRLRLWGSIGWIVPSLPVFLWLARRTPGATDLSFTLELAAGIEVLASAVSLTLPRTPPGARQPAAEASAELAYGESLKRLLRRRGFDVFLAVIFLVHSSFAVLFYYSPPFLEEAGFERKWVGPLQSIGVAAEVPFLFALPWAVRRLGLHGTITLGCAMLLLRQIAYAAGSPAWMLAASYVLAGVCVAFYLTGVSLSLNAMANHAVRATAQALFALVGAGLGQMFGHLAAGWIASRAGGDLRPAFIFASATVGLALALLVFGLRGKGLFPAGGGDGARRRDG